MTPQLAVRNVVVCATAWAAARQKLRGLTAKVEDLSDRKSTKPDDYVRVKKELEKTKSEVIRSAEKLEKAVGEFARLKVPLKLRGKPIDVKKIAGAIGTVARAFEDAFAPPPPPPTTKGWQPPANVIDVEVIDATPRK